MKNKQMWGVLRQQNSNAKRLRLLASVLVAVIGFSFAACDNGGGGAPAEIPVEDPFEDPFVDLPAEERWSSWAVEETGVTIAHSVDDDEVCTITVGGTALTGTPVWDYLWKATASYKYAAEKGKVYTYSFEAWTDGADRALAIQWYNDYVNGVYQGTGFENELPTFTITSEPKTYNIRSKEPIPKSGVQELAFQCANQTGTYHVKILSITGGIPSSISITGISGKTGNARLFVIDDNDWVAWGEGTISGNAVSFNLKQIVEGEYEGSIAYFLTDDLWYGSGSYYLELETDSTPNEEYGGFEYHAFYVYTGGPADTTGRGQKYTITSATSAIPFNQFAEREGGGGINPPGNSTSGTFTLSGIPPEYNGKHAFLQGHWNMEGDGYMVGVQTVTSAETYMLPVISNGSVSIPLWLNPDTEPTRFSDSTIYAEILVQIRDEPAYTINPENQDAAISQVSFYGVTFTNGSAARDWGEGQ